MNTNCLRLKHKVLTITWIRMGVKVVSDNLGLFHLLNSSKTTWKKF